MSAALVRGLQHVVDPRSDQWSQVLADAGLTAQQVRGEGELVPLDKGFAAFEAASVRAGNPTLGLAYAHAFEVGGTGPAGFATLSADTVEQALETISRFIPIVTSTRASSFVRDDRAGAVVWQYGGPDTPRLQFATFALALIMLRLAPAMPKRWQPLAVEVDAVAPPDRSAYDALFGRHGLQFRRGPLRLAVQAELLDRPMPMADPRLHAMMTRLAEIDLRRLRVSGTDLEGKARGLLSGLLLEGRVTAADLAAALGLTPAQMRSQLRQHGLDFRSLIEDVRREAAERYLHETGLSITDIAFRLGYSDSNLFTRACRKWFAATPSEVRARGRSGPRGSRRAQ